MGHKLSSTSIVVEQASDSRTSADPRWVRVRDLGDVDNIYDLGFRRNLRDALSPD